METESDLGSSPESPTTPMSERLDAGAVRPIGTSVDATPGPVDGAGAASVEPSATPAQPNATSVDSNAAPGQPSASSGEASEVPDPSDDPADPSDRSLIVARRTRMIPIATFDVPAIIRPIAPPEGWTDVLTGADGPRLWDRLTLSELARVARYHRPVTVAFAEIAGLDHLAGLWGWDVAARALASCARRLGREIRSSDHIARLEQARFGILLTETAEIAAINFVERARASCERELAPFGPDVRIGFGWASPPDGGDLSDAIAVAQARLAADLQVEPPA